MKICLVSQEYPPETAHGGIGSQVYNKARLLARLGHEVHVVSAAWGTASHTTKEAPTGSETGGGGITVHRVEMPGSRLPVNQPLTYWMGYTWAVFERLVTLQHEIAFDVIDFAEYGAEGFAYQLDRADWNRVPVVVQLYGPVAMCSERNGWPEPGSDFARVGAFMEGESIRHADALMACSANIADFTAARYGVDRAAIDVVYCCVDTKVFRPADRPRPAATPTVLFVGTLARYKGIHTVVNAILDLLPRHPHVRLKILGKGGEPELVQRLQKQVEAAGATKNIEFAGYVADRAAMPAFYQNASVFCAPAHHELGVANVYVEAMSCGCPVVAANAGGAPEAVTDGINGLLVPPHDVEAMSEALDRILSDPALGHRMGEAGRRRAAECFSMDKCIERVLVTYQKAIDRSKAITHR